VHACFTSSVLYSPCMHVLCLT